MGTKDSKGSQRQVPLPFVFSGSESQGDALVEEAREAQAAEVAELASLEGRYFAAYQSILELKQHQVERIMERLEDIIERDAFQLRQTQLNLPGLFTMPSTRARWQQNIQQQQDRIQRMQERLESVREIRDGMTVHGSRINDLVMQRLRNEDPDLVADWEEHQATIRLHQAMLRNDERASRRQGQGMVRGDR